MLVSCPSGCPQKSEKKIFDWGRQSLNMAKKYEVSRFRKTATTTSGYWDYFKLVKVFHPSTAEFWTLSNVSLSKMWLGTNDGKYIGYAVNWTN